MCFSYFSEVFLSSGHDIGIEGITVGHSVLSRSMKVAKMRYLKLKAIQTSIIVPATMWSDGLSVCIRQINQKQCRVGT